MPAVITPTAARAPRIVRALQRWWIDQRIRWAEEDIEFFESYDNAPHDLIRSHERQIEAWRVERSLLED